MRTKTTIGIRETVEYLALNGPETSELGNDEFGYDIMIMMAAHLFDREPKDLCDMVVRKRGHLS